MTGSLYQWPPTARFGRVVPKTKFYEHATITGVLREKFVGSVQRIVWAYKLAEETIHLRGDSVVPEIQVFVIEVKGDDVATDVLTAIDKAVQTPIIFEVNRPGPPAATRMVAAHKQLGGSTPKLSAYATTGWVAADAPRAPLPPALDLPGLYEQLLSPLLPLARRPDESLVQTTARIDQVRKLQRKVAALERRLRNEPQFNRKVELRRQLRDCTAALDALTSDPVGGEDQWRS